jgi:hypothetical protein
MEEYQNLGTRRPRCAMRRPEQVQQRALRLLDHLVCTREQRGWNLQSECCGCFEVYH